MRQIWIDLFAEHFSESPVTALSVRAVNMLRSYCKEWNNRNVKQEWVSDFLPWMFANWPAVRTLVVHWMTDFPDQPEPMLLANAKLRPHLEGAYNEQQRLASLRALTPREREIRELIRSKGMDRATAEKMAKTRDEAASLLKHAKDQLANAKIAEERAMNIRTVAANPKPKPRPLAMSAEDCAAFEEAYEERTKEGIRRRVAAAVAKTPAAKTVAAPEPIPEKFPDWD